MSDPRAETMAAALHDSWIGCAMGLHSRCDPTWHALNQVPRLLAALDASDLIVTPRSESLDALWAEVHEAMPPPYRFIDRVGIRYGDPDSEGGMPIGYFADAISGPPQWLRLTGYGDTIHGALSKLAAALRREEPEVRGVVA